MKLNEHKWYRDKELKNAEFYQQNGRQPSWREYQILHNFRETNYSVKQCEWRMLDYGNPSWTFALAFGGSN